MPVLGTVASSMLKVAGVFESISSVTASGGESSLSITSIPQTYKHLQVRGWVKTNNTGSTGISNGYFRLNGDTNARPYSDFSSGGANFNTAVATAANGDSYSLAINGSTGGQSSVWAFWVLDIFDYTNTSTNKSYIIKTGASQGAASTSAVGFAVGAVNFTSAITSITFPDLTGNNYKAGTYFALYGIKGA